MRTLTLVAVALVAAIAVQAAPAATSPRIEKCLETTRRTALNVNGVMAGLGLTGNQTRELRGRLAGYHSLRGFRGFDGIGLTTAQIGEMKRRIAAQNARMYRYPLGWPCASFSNRARVIGFIRAKLLYHGFRPAMAFTRPNRRQVYFRGVQDGYQFFGVLVKSGRRQIVFRLSADYLERTYYFNLGFEA